MLAEVAANLNTALSALCLLAAAIAAFGAVGEAGAYDSRSGPAIFAGSLAGLAWLQGWI